MKPIITATLLCIITTFAYAHQIAITFDDLPSSQNEPAGKQRVINQRILTALDKFNAPATGFVNEDKLYSQQETQDQQETQEKTEILQSWINRGHLLGNHTYSHKAFSATEAEEFEQDVIKGAEVSKVLMSKAGLEYRYFRHPYLDTGTSPDKRASFERFLTREGYIISPITIDTDDWKFNQVLLEHPEDQAKIIQEYIDHTRAKFDFYESASKKMFGRNIKHTWLLHVNLINSLAMEDLLKMVQERGYDFVTLDKALEDKAYAESDNFYGPYGVSWLYRWDFTRGKVVDWTKDPEPDHNFFINATSLALFDKTRNRSIPVERYVNGGSDYKAKAGMIKLPVVILSHGYTMKNSEYSFIANSLAAQGYFVASIQHDIEGDPNLPMEGKLDAERKSHWERGVKNIQFVLEELKRTDPTLDVEKVTLMGHSNGGDISMLFASLYPKRVQNVISLDSLRMRYPSRPSSNPSYKSQQYGGRLCCNS
jgi:peptidoglycan/xylan/chitin deacetylase (PgdA/CDA1 family)